MNAVRLPLVIVIVALKGASLAAQAPQPEGQTPRAARPDQPAAAPTAAPARPEAAERDRGERAVSPGLAAALSERMPRYNPPPPPREPTEEELAASQPRNQIIRLPQVVVEGERPPVFTDRDLHTSRGMAELAINRYLSELDRGVLNRHTLPLFGMTQEQRALQEYAEEERLRHIQTNENRAQMIRATEGADAAREFRDIANDTFMRSPYLPLPDSIRRRD
jgi:hypothetical protein